MMLSAGLYQRAFRRGAFFIGLMVLAWAAMACGSIIEVVPRATATPPPTATPLAASIPPAAADVPPPDRIVAATINLDAPVVAMGWQLTQRWGQWVSEWDMPENDAAWHRNSARPGEGSNIVLSGHNASTGGHVFADLEELQPGDEITLWTATGDSFRYHVVEKNIVRSFASTVADQNYLAAVTQATPQEQLTLITCWPRWTNTHRLVVIAKPG